PVTIQVSAAVSVPAVVGLAQAAATSAITSAGLTAGAVTAATSAAVPLGSVISQTPVGGTSVASGSAVTLVVSLGPAPVALWTSLVKVMVNGATVQKTSGCGD